MPRKHHNKLLSIKVFPRIHLGLLSMSGEGYRLNGGIGFTISAPCASVTFRPSRVFNLRDHRVKPFNDSELARIESCLTKGLRQFNVNRIPLSISISGPMPSHCGFGSATSIRLACLEGVFLKLKIPIDRKRLVELSGRGGTSGIGINTYFSGGLVLDLGRRGGILSPSSASEGMPQDPLTLCKHSMPRWRIGTCLIPASKTISGRLERKFFASHAKLKLRDVEKATHIALFGLTAGALERDFQTFYKALNDMQKTRWKSAEWALHGVPLQRAKRLLFQNGAEAVAMSSLGPSLIFMGREIQANIEKLRGSFPTGSVNLADMRNGGRVISDD
jgi:beta-ribofuranosylaminobenzene 5'-phosphate synthase